MLLVARLWDLSCGFGTCRWRGACEVRKLSCRVGVNGGKANCWKLRDTAAAPQVTHSYIRMEVASLWKGHLATADLSPKL